MGTGSHLPRGETLLANGSSLALPNNHQGTLWLPGPSAWDPQAPYLPVGEMEWQRLLVPFLLQPGCGAGGDDQAWVSSAGVSACVVRGLPHTHWENQIASHSFPTAHWLDSNEAPTGLCGFFVVVVFLFLSFITILLIWTCSLGFKVAWLDCCQRHVSLHCSPQPVNVTHILLD